MDLSINDTETLHRDTVSDSVCLAHTALESVLNGSRSRVNSSSPSWCLVEHLIYFARSEFLCKTSREFPLHQPAGSLHDPHHNITSFWLTTSIPSLVVQGQEVRTRQLRQLLPTYPSVLTSHPLSIVYFPLTVSQCLCHLFVFDSFSSTLLCLVSSEQPCWIPASTLSLLSIRHHLQWLVCSSRDRYPRSH